MRASLIFILWLLLGLAYWFISKNCCPVAETLSERTIAPVSSVAMTKLSPISFECSDDKPNVETRWNRFRDSLVNTLKDNEILQIKGFDFEDETNSTGSSSLGLARALKVRELFSLGDDKVRVIKGRKGDDCRKEEMYNLIAFNALKSDAKVIETDDETLIYFPFNSTNKLSDVEVEGYLDKVAARVKQSGERVQLTGHTDNVGDDASNLRLGQRRADVIKNYLVSKGVSASKIISRSQGEASPISSNDNERGRANNRRTQLQIVK